MRKPDLRQIFKNNSDCYADTWHSERGFMQEGEVIQAMTEDVFVKVAQEYADALLSELSKPAEEEKR